MEAASRFIVPLGGRVHDRCGRRNSYPSALFSVHCGPQSRLVGFLDTPGSSRGALIQGDYAFVASAAGDLQIVDVSKPAVPNLLPDGSW